MQEGRLTEKIRRRSVIKKIKYQSRQLVYGMTDWEDCVRFDVRQGEHMVFSADAVTGHPEFLAQKAFYRMANRVAASGAEPVGMLMTLLLPETAEESFVKQVMEQTAGLAADSCLDILGNHTEVLSTVAQPVLSLTGVGFLPAGTDGRLSKIRAGADIVMTKWAGATGAAEMVAADESAPEKKLRKRFSVDFLEQTAEHFHLISSVPEAKLAVKAGAAVLHCAGAEGVLDALWELGEKCGSGLEADIKKISIRQETVEICEFFDRNPYMIPSDGVLFAVTETGEQLVQIFAEAGIPAAVIGSITAERARVVWNGDERRFLAPRGSSMW